MTDMDELCTRSIYVTGRKITIHGECCDPVFIVYEGAPLCKRHYLKTKASEDCPICFFTLKEGEKIMLECGHFFHIHCLSKCLEPVCPICRKQLNGVEGAKVFTSTMLKPIIEEIYKLPKGSIKQLIDTFWTALDISKKSEWHADHINTLVGYLEHAYSITENSTARDKEATTNTILALVDEAINNE
jgi:hypothetical protein